MPKSIKNEFHGITDIETGLIRQVIAPYQEACKDG